MVITYQLADGVQNPAYRPSGTNLKEAILAQLAIDLPASPRHPATRNKSQLNPDNRGENPWANSLN
jgi:hypothetical protein